VKLSTGMSEAKENPRDDGSGILFVGDSVNLPAEASIDVVRKFSISNQREVVSLVARTSWGIDLLEGARIRPTWYSRLGYGVVVGRSREEK